MILNAAFALGLCLVILAAGVFFVTLTAFYIKHWND